MNNRKDIMDDKTDLNPPETAEWRGAPRPLTETQAPQRAIYILHEWAHVARHAAVALKLLLISENLVQVGRVTGSRLAGGVSLTSLRCGL